MNQAISRRQLLRGDIHGRRAKMRPPWALSEDDFITRCERCNECVDACPERILVAENNGYPYIDFSRGGCTFCGDCLVACKGRALRGDMDTVKTAWSLRASIESGCLAIQGIECRACSDSCDERAIRFRLAVGRVAQPDFNKADCNGCGACYSVCPVKAVVLRADQDINLGGR